MLDVSSIREDFPILNENVYGHPLVYLDNAATMQMPRQVMDCIVRHYSTTNANVHRGVHYLSERSTSAMEQSRQRISRFLGADGLGTVVFVSGATEGINLAAQCGVRQHLSPGKKVVVTHMEHHSNFVVWQELCHQTGARLVICPLTDAGELDMDFMLSAIDQDCAAVAVCAVSNVLGTANDVATICHAAREVGAVSLVDAAQAMRHGRLDVDRIGCDFLAFSGHKVMAPSGTGALYVSDRMRDRMVPYRFGGGMVDQVGDRQTSYADLPLMLEAGTPNISGNIALASALDYLEELGLDQVATYEGELLARAEQGLDALDGVHVLGHPKERFGAVSFVVDGVHPFDLATLLDKRGIAIRTGHHCAQPLLRSLGQSSVVRISPAFYNTPEEVDYCIEQVSACSNFLRKFSK